MVTSRPVTAFAEVTRCSKLQLFGGNYSVITVVIAYYSTPHFLGCLRYERMSSFCYRNADVGDLGSRTDWSNAK